MRTNYLPSGAREFSGRLLPLTSQGCVPNSMNSLFKPPPHALAVLVIVLPWLNPFASGPSPSVTQWLVTLVGASIVLVLLALRQISDAQVLARLCALGWLLAALISSALGVAQYFGVSSALTPWVNSTEAGNAFANLRQRNQFATLTNVGLAALLWWETSNAVATLSERTGGQQRVHKVALLFMACVLGLGNATSSSRTGLVQMLLLGVLVAAWRANLSRESSGKEAFRWTLQLWVAALLTYAMALWALPRLANLDPGAHGLLARLADGDRACTSRLTLWNNVLYLIAQKPWLGWGWGELDYAHYITLFPSLRFCEILDNAHNLPLHLAVELGVPLAALLCLGALGLCLRARPWRETNPGRRMAWAVLAVILLHSMLEYPLWYGPFLMAAILSIGLLAWKSPTASLQENTPPPQRAWTAPVAWVAAIVLLALAGITGRDYHRASQIYLAPSQRAPEYRTDTLSRIQNTWLFRNQVNYAELTITPVTAGNAPRLHAMALELLHFSPEPRVIEKLLESALRLGLEDEAQFHLHRYRAAFPEDYQRWLQAGAQTAPDQATD